MNIIKTIIISLSCLALTAGAGGLSPVTNTGNVTATGTQALTNKDLTDVSNTFPTFNQNTTGSAAKLSITGQTGLLTFIGLTSTNRAKTLRDAADTILELGGTYSPTAAWTFGGGITFATTSSSLPAANIPTGGALETTPAAGDIEADANVFYGTTNSGNRGYISPHYIIRANTTVTQSNDNNPHAIFTTPTNGALTLPTGTYRFKGQLAWTSMSATSGNVKVDILGAGGATTGSWLWHSLGFDGSAGGGIGVATSSGGWYVTSASGQPIVISATNTNCYVEISGSFQVTVTGTIIPTQTLGAAAAAVLSVSSYIEFWRVGSTSLTSIGNWN